MNGKLEVGGKGQPVWSYWSPIRCLPRWQIGERSPDMGDTGEIKYLGQTKTSTTTLWLAEGSVRARGRKPRRQVTWPSRLGVVRGGSYPFTENRIKAKETQRTNIPGWLKRNRRWRGQRNKNPKLYIGTWNIKTLLKPGKMQELAEELGKTQLEIVAIQEIRWSGSGVIKKKYFSLYYSGTKEQVGLAGTGFIIMGRTINSVIGFEAINERFCKIRLKGKYNNVTLVNIYMPQLQTKQILKKRIFMNNFNW